MNHRQQIGRMGEESARQFLINQGYRIIASNVKISYKELDIIARKGNQLIFVEVRTRTSSSFGTAEENFGPVKVNKLKQAIVLYLIKFKPLYKELRLDFIVVRLNSENKAEEIKHYIDVA